MRAPHIASAILLFGSLWTSCVNHVALSGEAVRLVHISDIHASRAERNPPPRFTGDPLVNDLVHSLEILHSAVDHINKHLRPELVVITGDLVDRGDDLDCLKEVKRELDRLTCPYYPVTGDHDRRATYEKVFTGKLNYSFDRRGWHFICLDSGRGKLEAKTVKWLQDNLSANPKSPTVIVLHRLLVLDVLSKYLADNLYRVKLMLENADEVRGVLQSHSNVRLVLSGNMHVPSDLEADGIRFLVAPALVVAPHCVLAVELSRQGIKTTVVAVPSPKISAHEEVHPAAEK